MRILIFVLTVLDIKTKSFIMATSISIFTSTLHQPSLASSSPLFFDITTAAAAATAAANNTNFTTIHNYTEEEKQQYLSDLQDQTTIAMIPAMVFLIILATVGLIGNSLVLIVYSKKFKQTSTRIFIMAIASFDIVTNVVAIPGEIYDMFHIWDFDQPMVCKARLYINAFTTMVAAMVLVAVAVVRYRKICKPFQTQVSVNLAKILSLVLAVLSLIFSIPYAIINGRQTKATPRVGIDGFECTIDDEYVDTIWPVMNGAFFIFLFVACSIPLVVMYILIGITAWKHSKVYGAATYTKGKDQKSNDIGKETSTKTTDDSSGLKFTKTPKTRSFVRNKSDSTAGSYSEIENKQFYNNQIQDNKDKSTNDKQIGNDGGAGDNTNEKSSSGKSNMGASLKTKSNNCDIRTVRSPTGETVHINLSMVKELTMKLKAVKKEAESMKGKNDDNCNEPYKADCEDKSLMSSIKSHDEFNDKTHIIDNEHVDKSQLGKEDNVEERKFTKKKIHRNKSAENNLCAEVGKLTSAVQSKRFSKSLNDLSRLTCRPSSEKRKKKAAENEDIDLGVSLPRESSLVFTDRIENAEKPESEAKDEPISEFAKAMEWVDLTYCLSGNQKDNENGRNESNGEEPDTSTLSKKGSFAIGRKISRDNSFLQRHKKLKDALTDTLTRARRNRKDRENADVDGRDYGGNGGLENIHSESENTGNDDETDNLVCDKRRRPSEPAVQHELKIAKRKASEIKELTSDESGNTVKVTNHQARRRGVGRTTGMLILISAVYIFGFLPFLGIMFAKAASPNTFLFMELSYQAVTNFFLRSYFLNSAANPIIYSLCDINFRRECIKVLKRS